MAKSRIYLLNTGNILRENVECAHDSSISINYAGDLKKEIERAIQERNEWVHQTNSGSVDIPAELTKKSSNFIITSGIILLMFMSPGP